MEDVEVYGKININGSPVWRSLGASEHILYDAYDVCAALGIIKPDSFLRVYVTPGNLIPGMSAEHRWLVNDYGFAELVVSADNDIANRYRDHFLANKMWRDNNQHYTR